MGTGIDGPPNRYPAGLDFDYSVWTAGTVLDLVNVNWNNDYRDVWLKDRVNLDAYIDEKSGTGIKIEKMMYAKPGEDIHLNIPYNRVNRFNYLRASNPLMPVEGDIQKSFYYFILDCEYVSPNTTRLRLQLDVWQTYVYDVQFGNCYVERGHVAIANENAFRNHGRDYLTVPEGFDAGSDFQILYSFNEFLIANTQGSADQKGAVVVASSVDLLASNVDGDGKPQLKSAKGGRFAGMPSGASMYVFSSETSFRNWLQTVQDKPWVTQGIMSATLIPNPTRYGIPQTYTDGQPVELHQQAPLAHIINFQENWREQVKDWIPERYRHLLKFLTSEYMIVELTLFMANPIAIKPELWANEDLEFEEIAAVAPPNQKISIFPRGYNAYSNGTQYQDEEVNFATHMANMPTMAIVNNAAIGYLAANRNAILHQRESAGWSQQRALGMAAGQYDVATGAMGLARELTNIGIGADILNTGTQNRNLASQAIINAVSQGVSGVGNALTPSGFLGSAISGVASGAATGANAAVQTSSNDEMLATRNQAASSTVGAQNRQSQLSRDTNLDLARFAARGDYANTIAGINAKVQDANMIQPTVSGQMGGDSLNYVNNLMRVRATIKRIDTAATRVIGEYWLRYGYAIRAFIKPPQNLKVMSKFSYWKMSETYLIAANVPEGHKQVLRGILEKGTTVWDDPDDIGVIDFADNVPLEGISY